MEMIEQTQISRRFTRALTTYDRHAGAQQQITQRLINMLRRHTDMRFGRVLEIGCGSGGFTRRLKAGCTVDEWWVNDLCEACHAVVGPLLDGSRWHFLPGDAETVGLPCEGTIDLVASASALQWMNDQRGFLKKLAKVLAPGGTLLFNTFTPENLHEIRTLTGRGLAYPETADIRRWTIGAGLRLIEEETETIRLTFDTPLEVLRHLKLTGVTATGSPTTWTRRTQAAFCDRYRQLFSDGQGKVTLTYSPLYMLAVKQ